MKRKYDFDTLALRYGFSSKEIEKVCRISDLLEEVSAVKFLSDRLSLYGGTALTFIYSPQILRLSTDLDFNYRHTNTTDWGEVRKEIDQFFDHKIFKPNLIDNTGLFHEKIAEYPAALRTLQQI